MILGKFFPDKAIAAMQTIEANLATFKTLFPVGSEAGHDTAASPAIWQDMDDFEARADAVIASAMAAEAAAALGQKSFTLAWQEVSKGCLGCHKVYAPTLY